MWGKLLELLGVTPEGEKTGKREAAWALVFIAAAFTIAAMIIGAAMVTAMTAILMALWASAILAVAGAYKLEHDVSLLKQKSEVLDVPFTPNEHLG